MTFETVLMFITVLQTVKYSMVSAFDFYGPNSRSIPVAFMFC